MLKVAINFKDSLLFEAFTQIKNRNVFSTVNTFEVNINIYYILQWKHYKMLSRRLTQAI